MAKIKTSKSGKDTPKDESADAAPHGPVAAQTLDPMLLNGLVCPKTRTPLTYDREANELISKKAKLAYPIREGVPIMLIEDAREL